MPNYPDSDRLLDQALRRPGAAGTSLRHAVTLRRDWLPVPDTLTLEPEYRLTGAPEGCRILVRLDAHELFLDQPVALMPVTVPKPWGRELWFTGMEARGESAVRTNAGALPLSQYLALAPRRLTGGAEPVLLKILDPHPDPVVGDLYFEAHDNKREVYVVSHVHPQAWPDGRGAIRYGMNQDLRRRYRDDDAFRRDYLHAVKRYEGIRRALDDGRPVPPHEEARCRADMEAFTELRPLAVGDVVIVPTWLPHSLLHGVRVIEFQTPSYQRYILSFTQRVLTQDHWDTEAAVGRIRLDSPDPAVVENVTEGVERVAGIEDFQVWRITVDAGAEFCLPSRQRYRLCVVMDGQVELEPLSLGPGDAALVPALALSTATGVSLVNRSAEPATVLLAAPHP